MIERPTYLNILISFKDKKLIKIITGIRRCGKSTLFELYQDYLLKNGIMPNQIRNINLEDADYRQLLNWENLHDNISKNLLPDKMNYIFLDEIQNVADFQRAADSLFIKKNVDLYLTGSNARMLSGEIATLLSGRYIEIQMLPLSFKEYLSACSDKSNLPEKFKNYLSNSGFPYTLEFNGNRKEINRYLGGIYNTILLKDIVSYKKISDISRLESVIHFMFSNIGNETSINNIRNTMKSDGKIIEGQTIENYLDCLIDSFVLYRANRFDIKGKQYLKTNEKYYLVDIGLRNFLLGRENRDEGHILENIVYLELLRR
ncbi:MAG: ATP-binding protein, partial [Endomicrobium sp.]|nr:ATP-binding protein [Endomicrobium sp.]